MGATLIPTPSYHDPHKAIEFLVEAFGFQRHAIYRDENDTIAHAELTLGSSMIMPSTPGKGEYGQLVATVADAGKPTGGFYVVVEDPVAHHERALAAGAEVVIAPQQRDYGGSDYTCRDLEGHLWTFGSYDPWATTG